jgi:hypothetical protein
MASEKVNASLKEIVAFFETAGVGATTSIMSPVWMVRMDLESFVLRTRMRLLSSKCIKPEQFSSLVTYLRVYLGRCSLKTMKSTETLLKRICRRKRLSFRTQSHCKEWSKLGLAMY